MAKMALVIRQATNALTLRAFNINEVNESFWQFCDDCIEL